MLAEYIVPHDFKIRDDFPLTPIGKIDPKALQNEDNVIELSKSKILKK